MGIGSRFTTVLRNLFAQFVRTLKPPGKGPPRQWCVRLEKMKRCRTVSELVDQFGQPAHTIQTGGMEIMHYPLGITGGLLYTVHAVHNHGSVSQIYMHMEPASEQRGTQHGKI
jgi:hypothetical protein